MMKSPTLDGRVNSKSLCALVTELGLISFESGMMPKKLDTAPTISPDMAMAQDMYLAFMEKWRDEMGKSNADQMRFSRLSVVALTQLAAVVGVDVGMSVDQFKKVCEANFNEAYDRAPKFGE